MKDLNKALVTREAQVRSREAGCESSVDQTGELMARTPYDEAKHIENLRRTNSPIIAKMQEMNLIENENTSLYA